MIHLFSCLHLVNWALLLLFGRVVPIKLTDHTPFTCSEEDLTAEQMEECLTGHEICPQARHFATLALKHYNSKRVVHFCKAFLTSCHFPLCHVTCFTH